MGELTEKVAGAFDSLNAKIERLTSEADKAKADLEKVTAFAEHLLEVHELRTPESAKKIVKSVLAQQKACPCGSKVITRGDGSEVCLNCDGN